MSSLAEAPSLHTISTPLRSTKFTNSYVLQIASLPGSYAISASAPSNEIHLLDKATLQSITRLGGHENGITAMRAVEAIGSAGSGGMRRALVSCGRDGVVKAWDERAGAVGLHMNMGTRSRALLSLDVSRDGYTVAAGTELQGDDALILYWDPRNAAAPLRKHASTHSDDVTAVNFLPYVPGQTHNVLLSASTDGLVCTSKAEENDEDEAGIHVGNWGCSVSQCGWFGGERPRIWAASDMETFSVWSSELDLVHNQNIKDPSVHSQERTWVTDYLINCHASGDSLGVFVGSNDPYSAQNLTVPAFLRGDIALLTPALSLSSKFSSMSIESNGMDTGSNSDATGMEWTLQAVWSGGHVGVVRSVLMDEEHNLLLTGGEDSKLNVWPCTLPALVSADRADDADMMEVDVPLSAARKRDLEPGSRRASAEIGTKKLRR